MTKDAVAVLEVGSQRISCVIGQRGINGTFLIKSLAECEYDGFSDSQFFDVTSLAEAVKDVIAATSKNARMAVDKLYVSVPGEFSVARTKESTLAFARKKRIKKRDIEDLHASFTLPENADYVITDVSAVYYVLDDNRRVANPEGVQSFKLGGLLSYMFCDKYYISLLTSICKKAGVKSVEFISETMAESKYLTTNEERDLRKITVDVGYLTTNVFISYGGGVLYQKAFSDGGGYITAQLMEKMDVDFDIAEYLKRKINLGYDTAMDGNYHLTINDIDYAIPLQKANFTVRFCLDGIAEKIDTVLRECPMDLRINAPISLTGGGISFMRGAKEYLSSRVAIPMKVVAPNIPYMNKPDESACLSLLNEALERNKK